MERRITNLKRKTPTDRKKEKHIERMTNRWIERSRSSSLRLIQFPFEAVHISFSKV